MADSRNGTWLHCGCRRTIRERSALKSGGNASAGTGAGARGASPDDVERDRLKSVLTPIKPENMAVIVRTAARGVADDILVREMQYLVEQWKSVQEKFAAADSPALLHRDLELTQRVVREQYSEEVGKIIVDDAKLVIALIGVGCKTVCSECIGNGL